MIEENNGIKLDLFEINTYQIRIDDMLTLSFFYDEGYLVCNANYVFLSDADNEEIDFDCILLYKKDELDFPLEGTLVRNYYISKELFENYLKVAEGELLCGN